MKLTELLYPFAFLPVCLLLYYVLPKRCRNAALLAASLLFFAWTKGHPRREVCYRADKITGPYEKKVILETEFAGFNGVGQGTIVDDKDGNWYGIVFQDRGGVGRVLTLEPCTWKIGRASCRERV